jgi:hypothetical protein
MWATRPVGLLLAHVAGADLGRITDPNLVAQLLQQINKPLAVAARLDTYPRWRRQSAIKALRFAIAVHQLVFADLPGLGIQNRNLLPLRMKITTYNDHRRLLRSSSSWSSIPLASRSSQKPSSLSHQRLGTGGTLRFENITGTGATCRLRHD